MKKGKLKVVINKKKVTDGAKKQYRCGLCHRLGHTSKTCTTEVGETDLSARAAKKLLLGQKDVYDPRPKSGKPPVDEHVYNNIKERKNDDMTASEIAERYEMDRDLVADIMISPSWGDYSKRFTG